MAKSKADVEHFDCSDVTWEVEQTKRTDQIRIVLKSEGSFNTMKVYLSLKMICEKIESELNILEDAEGEH